MSSSLSGLNKTDSFQDDSCDAQQGRGGRAGRLVPSMACRPFVWKQPERKQSLGWGLTGLWDWTGQGVC